MVFYIRIFTRNVPQCCGAGFRLVGPLIAARDYNFGLGADLKPGKYDTSPLQPIAGMQLWSSTHCGSSTRDTNRANVTGKIMKSIGKMKNDPSEAWKIQYIVVATHCGSH